MSYEAIVNKVGIPVEAYIRVEQTKREEVNLIEKTIESYLWSGGSELVFSEPMAKIALNNVDKLPYFVCFNFKHRLETPVVSFVGEMDDQGNIYNR